MTEQWLTVDEGWGRRAVDYAMLLEPAACREYVALHQHLDVGDGDRVLDVASGSGPALELAQARGATASGIDASPRLVGIARDRLPDADIRVGDMAALPWDDDSFDVVTSFRGLWATTREALAEAHRVLRPGGRPPLRDDLGPRPTAGTALAEQDLADLGFVMNATELWMHDPDGHDELFALIGSSAKGAGLSVNGALGARPEQEYVDPVDSGVRAAWEQQAGGRIG